MLSQHSYGIVCDIVQDSPKPAPYGRGNALTSVLNILSLWLGQRPDLTNYITQAIKWRKICFFKWAIKWCKTYRLFIQLWS